MIALIAQEAGASIRDVCKVLEVPRSSFYHAATPTATQVADADLGDQIEAIFRHHRRRYGYRRIAAELAERGITCSALTTRLGGFFRRPLASARYAETTGAGLNAGTGFTNGAGCGANCASATLETTAIPQMNPA
jgi:hypothetical protein